jgi:hypothetical protein
LPIWFILEWTEEHLSWSSLSRFGWGQFALKALMFPTIVALSMWWNRLRGRY